MPETHDTAKPRSEAQKAAARRNGAKSRGPVTSEGKAKSARNALRHGLTAFDLALSCEDQESFNLVLHDYMDEYCPIDATETNLVERIAFAQWQMYRAWTAETAILNVEIETNRAKLDEKFTHFAEPVRVADAIETSLARTGSLPHINRCLSRINREYFLSLKTLRTIRKEAAPPSDDLAETNPTDSDSGIEDHKTAHTTTSQTSDTNPKRQLGGTAQGKVAETNPTEGQPTIQESAQPDTNPNRQLGVTSHGELAETNPTDSQAQDSEHQGHPTILEPVKPNTSQTSDATPERQLGGPSHEEFAETNPTDSPIEDSEHHGQPTILEPVQPTSQTSDATPERQLGGPSHEEFAETNQTDAQTEDSEHQGHPTILEPVQPNTSQTSDTNPNRQRGVTSHGELAETNPTDSPIEDSENQDHPTILEPVQTNTSQTSDTNPKRQLGGPSHEEFAETNPTDTAPETSINNLTSWKRDWRNDIHGSIVRFRLAFAACLLAALSAWAAKPIDFQREIRPILSDNCFQCHGPDATSRMANLRLDLKDAALEKRKSGTAAVVPKDAAASLLYQRIIDKNPSRKMPPAYSHKTVTDAQAALIKRWIDEGAPWQEHWAYRAPAKPNPPAVRNPAWVRNPIDRFVLARLEAAALAPAERADKRTLIRRVALDLTGLPPTPADVDAFVKDLAPNAYEKMVDRYLASIHYGEHRARYWLDAARYGDTHGIHVDNYREMWPYRDWVIHAFNRNLPFDKFTIEQLAGDMLPNATLEQKIASGFQRCNTTTNEAGLIEDEYAEIYAKDRAETVGAVWLGLTVGCATCHDHKFDPILQKDFYALGAFFRNTTQRVMDDNIPDTPPILVVPREDDRARWDAVSSRLAEVRKDISRMRADAKVPASYTLPPTARPMDSELFTLKLKDLDTLAANLGHLGETPNPNSNAFYFHENAGVEVPTAPPLDANKPFTVSVGFYYPKAEQPYTIAAQQDPKDKNRGWVIDVGARVAGMRLIGDNGLNIEVRAAHLEQLQHGTWNHIVVTYDGSRQQSGLTLYLNGRAIMTQGGGNQNTMLPGSIAPANTPLILGRSLASGAIADFRMFSRVASEAEAVLLSQWTSVEAGDPDALSSYWLLKENPVFGRLSAEQNTLNLEAKAIARRGAITHVMNERTDQMPYAHVLFRGAYDQKRARVDAGTPGILPPMKADQPRNRLGFAQWLMSDEHPLTARVNANRMWQEIFGTGLVKSAEDFGSQGEPPVNQDLLDWLAVDFRESKWDVKRFYKQVLMSAAYQQSAAATPAKLAKDPENRLLSRGPRFRMDAEMVRDYALASSGLLVPAIGGPSVKPYQPDGVWEAVAMIGSNTRFYKRDEGDKLYRRSLYTFWKRSAPPANMDVFNAPTREACTVRRERTNTPLQALATMNDIQFVEAARVLAERAYKSGTTLDTRMDFLSRSVTARSLTPAERAIAVKAYQSFLKTYDSKPEEAKKLIAVGEKKSDASIPPAEHAALTMLANQLLNLDEVLNK